MSRSEQMARIAQGYVEAKKFSGIEWYVEAKGEVANLGVVGFADAEKKSPVPEGALYRIFSMTKPVVSLLALQLVEQGRLRLYDMVAQYDPRFAQMIVLTPQGAIVPAERPITVEDLLTHINQKNFPGNFEFFSSLFFTQIHPPNTYEVKFCQKT